MTPARKAALQWFHDRGEVGWFRIAHNPPSITMKHQMVEDGHLQRRGKGFFKVIHYSLTDAGRRALEDAGK